MMKTMTISRGLAGASFVLVYLAPALSGPVRLCAQESVSMPDGSLRIESPRPLSVATEFLGDLYGKPVTFEEPVWMWDGDMKAKGEVPSWFLPGWLLPDQTASMEQTVQEVLDVIHGQNAEGPRFKIEKFRLGLHILPAEYHNMKGMLVPAKSILDAYVNVPAGMRMASEHLRAICESVKAATGVKLDPPFTALDYFYAANGLKPPRNASIMLEAKEKEQYSFVWGISGVTAREAVLSLFERSATTFSWWMLCDPPIFGPKLWGCALNVSPLHVRVTGEDGTVRIGSGYALFDRTAPPPAKRP
jgi:hypothetical protein